MLVPNDEIVRQRIELNRTNIAILLKSVPTNVYNLALRFAVSRIGERFITVCVGVSERKSRILNSTSYMQRGLRCYGLTFLLLLAYKQNCLYIYILYQMYINFNDLLKSVQWLRMALGLHIILVAGPGEQFKCKLGKVSRGLGVYFIHVGELQ